VRERIDEGEPVRMSASKAFAGSQRLSREASSDFSNKNTGLLPRKAAKQKAILCVQRDPLAR